jgi:prepilin-type N-terminal cleavage/methylation domain-containing protein
VTSKFRNLQRSSQASPESGFSLVEILVAVAILAILSATLSPLVIKFINDGRRARALSDAQTIGQAILAFQLDTGTWPVRNAAGANAMFRLVGLPNGNPNAVALPTPAANGWNGLGGAFGIGAGVSSIADHLIRNTLAAAPATVPVIYTASATPPEPPGWNGPYLQSVPLDPWGRPYVCNVGFLSGASVIAAANRALRESNHMVMCLSAGPNGAWDTALANTDVPLTAPAGDDIGWYVQGAR